MKTILVIDDEANIRELYRDELRDSGYRVLTAANWHEAQAVLERERPDLITLDIKLDEPPNGVEVLRLIKERDKSIPVIMVTAYGEYRSDFSVWASEGYVIKSANLSELKEKIAAQFGAGRD